MFERSRLLNRRTPSAFDQEVERIVAGLPPPSHARRKIWLVGIMNEQGMVYRQVALCTEFEFLDFSAKMNSAGFEQNPALQGAVSRSFARVFMMRRGDA